MVIELLTEGTQFFEFMMSTPTSKKIQQHLWNTLVFAGVAHLQL